MIKWVNFFIKIMNPWEFAKFKQSLSNGNVANGYWPQSLHQQTIHIPLTPCINHLEYVKTKQTNWWWWETNFHHSLCMKILQFSCKVLLSNPHKDCHVWCIWFGMSMQLIWYFQHSTFFKGKVGGEPPLPPTHIHTS